MGLSVVETDVVGVVLPPVDILEIAAGGDELIHHRPVVRGHPFVRERHLDRLEARQALLDVGCDEAGVDGGGGGECENGEGKTGGALPGGRFYLGGERESGTRGRGEARHKLTRAQTTRRHWT